MSLCVSSGYMSVQVCVSMHVDMLVNISDVGEYISHAHSHISKWRWMNIYIYICNITSLVYISILKDI